MWLKFCCSDCTEKMNYNVQLKMSCISGKGFLHSGFWHLPKYKIQKPHEVLVQRGHHFPLIAGETEAGDKKLSVLMPSGIPSTALQDTSEKDKSSGKGHTAVGNLCLLGQNLRVLVQLVSCDLCMALGWCQLLSSQLRVQPQKSGVFTCLGAAYLLCHYETKKNTLKEH